MSVRRTLFVAALLVASAAPALAEREPEYDDDFDELADEVEGTAYGLRFTSTSFAYRETGDLGAPIADGTAQPENASPVNRLFTDLRAQLDAKHISGGRWDFRLDTRLRYNHESALTSGMEDDTGATIPTQSGAFGGNEIDVRELYARRRGRKTDWTIGRQTVLELAATKIDGVRFEYQKSRIWRVVGFGGLYPTRGSRSILDDYRRQRPDPATPGAAGARVMPAAVGAAGAYRYRDSHGAVGAGAIFPLAEEEPGGQLEKPRVFLAANGYWRRSRKLDLYHYVVLDVEGAGAQDRETADPCGGRCRNVVLGANWHPRWTLRVNASLSHVDTETIDAQAKTRLEEPDPGVAGARIQNDVEVLRIASEAAQLGVSSAFKDMRFEVSVNGRFRRRPAFRVTGTDGTLFEFPKSQAAEVSLGVIDRRSFLGLRLFGTASSIFGVGARNLNRTEAKIVRIGGARRFKRGRGELEVDASYVATRDDNQGDMASTCLPGTLSPLDCYGTASATSASLGGLVFYQLSERLFAVASTRVGVLTQTVTDAAGGRLAVPRVLSTTGFLRLDYTFR